MKKVAKKYLPFGMIIVIVLLVCSQVNVVGNVITKVDLYNVVTPYYGKSQFLNVKIPRTAKYHIANELELRNSRRSFESYTFMDDIESNHGVWWEIEGSPMNKKEKFVCINIPYRMGALLVADEGYTFAKDVKIRVNGRKSNVGSYCNYGSELFVASKDYYVKKSQGVDPTIKNYISSIEINDLTLPKNGEKPDFEVQLPEDAHYHLQMEMEREDRFDEMQEGIINGVLWTRVDENEQFTPMREDDVFDHHSVGYRVHFYIVADKGYRFAENTTITINGESELIEARGVDFTRFACDSILFET